MGWKGDVEFAISSDDFFLNIYVIDIHQILTFQMLGDTWLAAFYSAIKQVLPKQITKIWIHLRMEG